MLTSWLQVWQHSVQQVQMKPGGRPENMPTFARIIWLTNFGSGFQLASMSINPETNLVAFHDTTSILPLQLPVYSWLQCLS